MSDKRILGALARHAPGIKNLSLHGHGVIYGGNKPRFNVLYSALYKVVGTTGVAGTPDVPVARKVRLLNTKNCQLVREVWSDAGGNYRFDAVARGPWTVLAHDYTNEYNAVVADNVYGEPM